MLAIEADEQAQLVLQFNWDCMECILQEESRLSEGEVLAWGLILVGTPPQGGGGGGLYGPQNCRTEQCAFSAPEAPEILF